MKTREEVLDVLARAKPELKKIFKVKRIALFGSYARNEQHPHSDVDVLVEVDPSIGLGFVTLAETIQERLGIPAEVVSRRAVKPRHWKYIKGELIYV